MLDAHDHASKKRKQSPLGDQGPCIFGRWKLALNDPVSAASWDFEHWRLLWHSGSEVKALKLDQKLVKTETPPRALTPTEAARRHLLQPQELLLQQPNVVYFLPPFIVSESREDEMGTTRFHIRNKEGSLLQTFTLAGTRLARHREGQWVALGLRGTVAFLSFEGKILIESKPVPDTQFLSAVSDIEAQGRGEVFVVSDQARVYVFDGTSAALLRQFGTPGFMTLHEQTSWITLTELHVWVCKENIFGAKRVQVSTRTGERAGEIPLGSAGVLNWNEKHGTLVNDDELLLLELSDVGAEVGAEVGAAAVSNVPSSPQGAHAPAAVPPSGARGRGQN